MSDGVEQTGRVPNVVRVASDTFVGRGDELQVLRAAVRSVVDRTGSYVHVTGEAGIGTTSLLAAVAADLRSRGVPVRLAAVDETDRRRAIQAAYNVEHGITPTSTVRLNMEVGPTEAGYDSPLLAADSGMPTDRAEIPKLISDLSKRMQEAAEALDFETAAGLRDEIQALKDWDLGLVPDKRQAAATRAGTPFRQQPRKWRGQAGTKRARR